ncbi:MAG: MFS transporter, partial [Bdellovibrionales bacterium]|nr:MFS transporter [Bdellovibrionales bacterium]
MSKAGTEVVTLRTQVSYGAPALSLALMAITFYVYIPKFYSDVVGINLAVIGNIVLISRIWDALIDPAMGSISDRSRFAAGRRRPWIGLALLPLSLSFFFLLSPQLNVGFVSDAMWFAVWTVLFFLFWTMHSVPYEALGAEISFDYRERNRLFGMREGFLVLGTLFAAIVPAVYDFVLPGANDPQAHEQRKFVALSLFYGALLVGT